MGTPQTQVSSSCCAIVLFLAALSFNHDGHRVRNATFRVRALSSGRKGEGHRRASERKNGQSSETDEPSHGIHANWLLLQARSCEGLNHDCSTSLGSVHKLCCERCETMFNYVTMSLPPNFGQE